MGIRHTLSQQRPAFAAALVLALLLAALVFSSSPALAQSPPDPVGSVSVTRADGSLTASWSAPARATSYHVTYSADSGSSWRLAALNHTGTSITISAKNSATYVVGVRAGNQHGWSGWRNSAPAGPFTPPPPTTPPGTPSAVSVTRSDGAMTASWPAVSRATTYHVTYSSNHGKTWNLAASNHASSSITVSGVENGATYVVGVRAGNQHGWSGWRNSPPSGPYYPPTPPPAVPSGLKAYGDVGSVTLSWDNPGDSSIVHYEYRYRADSDAAFGAWTATPKDSGGITSYSVTGLTNGTKYHFKLRAVNSGGASAPTASVSATPEDGVTLPKPQPGILPPEPPASVTLTRAAGTLTADWSDAERATSYHVTYSADGGASWTLAASGHTENSITITGVSDTATYVVGVRGHNAGGYGQWRNSAPLAPPTPSLTVSSLTPISDTHTNATFTLTGYTGTWSYHHRLDQAILACVSPVTGQTTYALTMQANKTYNVTAYSGAGCTTANALDTVYFSTTDVAVGNLAEARDNATCIVGRFFNEDTTCALAFTTGAHSAGYTVKSISASFDSSNSNPSENIVVAIHAASSGTPAATALVTLSGSNPNTAGLYTYTCSGSGCDLQANTTYFVTMSKVTGSANAWYNWRRASSGDEYKYPSDNGWSIADTSKERSSSGGNWSDGTSNFAMHIAANEK